MKIAQRIWELGETEQFFHRRGTIANQVVSIAARHSEYGLYAWIYGSRSTNNDDSEETVREWAEKAAKAWAIELGPDSPVSRITLDHRLENELSSVLSE